MLAEPYIKYIFFLGGKGLSTGHAVAQLSEALRSKLEGPEFDSRLCHWNFSLTYCFRPHYDSGFYSVSNRTKLQEPYRPVEVCNRIALFVP
jgi:hypothetical protein